MVERKPEQDPRGVYDLNVPELRQKHITWCGLTSVAMVMKHWKYRTSPEELFTEMCGTYSESRENYSPALKPTFNSFALRIKKNLEPQPPFDPLTARVFTNEWFEKLKERTGQTPHDLLQHFVIDRKIPCIIRVPEHTMVVGGVDLGAERYLINNPAQDKIKTSVSFSDIDIPWASSYETKYPGNTRYLMLAIYPENYNWKFS